MSGPNRPSTLILKDILVKLFTRKLSPTPQNFAKIYEEVTGEKDGEVVYFDSLTQQIQAIPRIEEIAPTQVLTILCAKDETSSIHKVTQAFALLALSSEYYKSIADNAFKQILKPLMISRPDLLDEFDELLALNPNESMQFSDLASKWTSFFHKCATFSSVRNDLDTNMKKLVYAIATNIAAMIDDADASSGQIETLHRLAQSKTLTSSSLKDAEIALSDLAQRQTQTRSEMKRKKEELQNIVLEALRHFSAEASYLGIQSDKISDITTNLLDSDDNVLVRKSLSLLVEETKALSKKMQTAKIELTRHEHDIKTAQEQIAKLSQDLIIISKKVKEDSLTGVLNRRGLDEAAHREISLAARNQQSLVLALLDIDNFKSFNDALGHEGGDEALKYLANTLSGVLRPADTIARFGGEEFVILLPHSTIGDSKKILLRAQRALTKDLWLNQQQRLLTFSSGATAWRKGDDLHRMVSRADHLMYGAKKNGKNQVFIDGDDAQGPAAQDTAKTP